MSSTTNEFGFPNLNYTGWVLSSTIYAADASSMLRVMAEESVDLVITSPPYAERRKKAYGGIPADKYVE